MRNIKLKEAEKTRAAATRDEAQREANRAKTGLLAAKGALEARKGTDQQLLEGRNRNAGPVQRRRNRAYDYLTQSLSPQVSKENGVYALVVELGSVEDRRAATAIEKLLGSKMLEVVVSDNDSATWAIRKLDEAKQAG
eukprot:522094-Prymnesium_polylepis.1